MAHAVGYGLAKVQRVCSGCRAHRLRLAIGQCQLHDRPGLGPLRHHRPRLDATPLPADCEFDYGQGISLAPGEQAPFVCAGDTAFGADEVLPYGESINAGVMRCATAQSWITCRDVRTGHGFSISREAYRLF